MTTSSGSAPQRARLTSLEQITEHLRDSPQPFFYVSRSATNLLGVDRWVGGFHYITLRDSWDGAHPRAFAPSNVPALEPRGNINIVNWLLANDQVQQYIAANTPAGLRPKVVIAMFDEQTEALCASLGYELAMPRVALRKSLDSKIMTTQLGNEAGAPSVPNILTTITGWDDLRAQAEAGGLGENLVIQLPYGDSGRTTYFVASHADFERVASEITGPQIKVMRHINHLPLAVEAVITDNATVTGPVLREITGHPELTAYKGGWAGSELYPALLNDDARARTLALVERFCARLGAEGYRGILEVSVLLDTDTNEVYLGELNPRISGSSSHSNLTPGDTTLPLFAYHVLQFSDVDFELDLATIQAQRAAALDGETWSTLVIQYPGPEVDRVLEAPRTGRYRVLDDGARLEFVSADLDWQALTDPDEVFWMRAVGEGEVRGRGLDIGMLVTRSRSQEEHYALTPRTKRLIPAIQGLYRGKTVPLPQVYWRAGVRKLRELGKRSA
ncbi:biotin carboxylase [Leucobacter chromiireducens]|uniref:Biotin carboxylase n=1 Tax=Leucobacter chromiireducens subsp. chromiireducens TaxID=660067 RepID=A0ABS1SMW4_9MICO|nr:biotin carboxylase [Leucobacter chromiireducens]MBL3689245.1 biotin carboxylase [Leucobacter chromiireducens subsp. chromiireducens]